MVPVFAWAASSWDTTAFRLVRDEIHSMGIELTISLVQDTRMPPPEYIFADRQSFRIGGSGDQHRVCEVVRSWGLRCSAVGGLGMLRGTSSGWYISVISYSLVRRIYLVLESMSCYLVNLSTSVCSFAMLVYFVCYQSGVELIYLSYVSLERGKRKINASGE